MEIAALVERADEACVEPIESPHGGDAGGVRRSAHGRATKESGRVRLSLP
jgi:hypothetical protein